MLFDYLFKYIIIGNSGVGKSGLLLRFTGNSFCEDYSCTIGVDFGIKTIIHPLYEDALKLQLWDTAGHEIYRSITQAYYKNTAVAIIVYDITNLDSFKSLPNWYEDVKKNTNDNIITVLVGCKKDLIHKRQISYEEGKSVADSYSSLFFETSSLTGENVNDIFDKSSAKVYTMIKDGTLKCDYKLTNGIKTGEPDIPPIVENSYNKCCIIT